MSSTDKPTPSSSDEQPKQVPDEQHNWHETHAGQLTQAADSSKLSLPPNLERKPVRHQMPRAKWLALALLVLVSLAAGFLGGWLGSASRNSDNSGLSPTSSKQTVVSDQAKVINQISKTVGQSVVSILATSNQTTPNLDSFFGSSSGTQTQQDAGTGIIISADGLIITNRHVVPSGTTNVTVTLSDGAQYNNVKIIGRTSSSDSLDIAFLQIQNLNGKKLVPATIGDSSQMQVGDSVVAIGNALGQFQNTVTNGIISGYGRSVQASSSTGSSSENLTDLFQTDAAINEGNSGGPLVNFSGQVIGINTAIASNAQNIGFAIPINDVTGLIKSVEQTGKLERPYLGVVYIPITSDVAQQYNLSTNQGAWIPPSGIIGQDAIVSGGPADKAGLKSGDIITAINGQKIDQNTSLNAIIDKQSVGSTVTLTVNRNGKTITLKATLAAAPTSQ